MWRLRQRNLPKPTKICKQCGVPAILSRRLKLCQKCLTRHDPTIIRQQEDLLVFEATPVPISFAPPPKSYPDTPDRSMVSMVPTVVKSHSSALQQPRSQKEGFKGRSRHRRS